MTNAKPRSRAAIALFAAMVLFLPWPFDYIAVLSLASIPATVGFLIWGVARGAASSPISLAVALPIVVLTLAQAALGLFVFHHVARRFAAVLARSSQPRAALAIALALIFAASWLPLFGGGENFGGVRLHDLYVEYAHMAGVADCSSPRDPMGADPCEVAARKDASRARSTQPATLEGMGAPAIMVAPGGSAAIAPRAMPTLTVEQGRCLRDGGTPRACLGRDTP